MSETLTNWDKSRSTEVKRPYTDADVLRLRGSIQIEYTLARKGALRLWKLLQNQSYLAALDAATGDQAIEQVQAGLPVIYASTWPADADQVGQMYNCENPSLLSSLTNLVRNINKSLQRADQIHYAEGKTEIYWFAPIVADAQAGFGTVVNSFESMKALIEAGAAAVTFEDRLSNSHEFGRKGGKVVVPTHVFIGKLIAARLASDVLGVPTVLIARTAANAAQFVMNDSDSRDRLFITEERSSDGYLGFSGGLDAAVARGLAYAPYADLLWYETLIPNLKEAQSFAAAIHQHFPGKLLAYNCSASFDWLNQLDATTIRNFQVALSAMGYKFQFVDMAGFHSLNLGMFDLARRYRETGMAAYARLQKNELDSAEHYGYEAVGHQRFVGTDYLEKIAEMIVKAEFPNAASTKDGDGDLM